MDGARAAQVMTLLQLLAAAREPPTLETLQAWLTASSSGSAGGGSGSSGDAPSVQYDLLPLLGTLVVLRCGLVQARWLQIPAVL